MTTWHRHWNDCRCAAACCVLLPHRCWASAHSSSMCHLCSSTCSRQVRTAGRYMTHVSPALCTWDVAACMQGGHALRRRYVLRPYMCVNAPYITPGGIFTGHITGHITASKAIMRLMSSPRFQRLIDKCWRRLCHLVSRRPCTRPCVHWPALEGGALPNV